MSPTQHRRVAVVLGDPRLRDDTKVGARFSAEDLEAVVRMKAALAALDGYAFRYLDDHESLLADLTRMRDEIELVLNLCDTGLRNVATDELLVPAFLDALGVPCTGSGARALVLCYDKSLVRAAAAELGVPVPAQVFLRADQPAEQVPFPLPALIKPNLGDGGLGITADSVVRDRAAAIARIERLRVELPGRDLLVQELLTGTELGVTLLGNPEHGLEPLPPLVVDYGALDPELPPILGYESKTLPESPYWTRIAYRPAELDDGRRAELVGWSCRLFERLQCRDYARFDFRADAAGGVRLLEVNPNPAWCWDGKMALMAGFAGLSESALFGRILDAAWRRVAG